MSVSRLLKKRDEGTLMPTEAISFEKVLRTGSVYTVLSQDGRHVLVATPRSGPVNNSVIRGEVYLLNNETLVARELKPCGGLHADARLEYADFSITGRDVFVTRSWFVDTYDLEGKCVGESIQLHKTESPSHMVSGYLQEHYLIAADTIGHVWLVDLRSRGLNRPRPDLGRNEHDKKSSADPVVSIAISPDAGAAVLEY